MGYYDYGGYGQSEPQDNYEGKGKIRLKKYIKIKATERLLKMSKYWYSMKKSQYLKDEIKKHRKNLKMLLTDDLPVLNMFKTHESYEHVNITNYFKYANKIMDPWRTYIDKDGLRGKSVILHLEGKPLSISATISLVSIKDAEYECSTCEGSGNTHNGLINCVCKSCNGFGYTQA